MLFNQELNKGQSMATEIVNVRLPKELVKKLDLIIQKNQFTSRSEIIRQFLREYIQEQKDSKEDVL